MTLKFHQAPSMSSVYEHKCASELNGVKLDEVLVSGVVSLLSLIVPQHITAPSSDQFRGKRTRTICCQLLSEGQGLGLEPHETLFSANLAHFATGLVTMCLHLCFTPVASSAVADG